MTMSYRPGLTIEYHPYISSMYQLKIKTALYACFDNILSLTTQKVTFTTDLPLIPFYLT
jgi:hypothetical protein